MLDEREPAEPELTPDLKAIEGKLARLVPAGARVDRDRLMYEAGRAATVAVNEPFPSPSLQGRGSVWVWRGVSAFMTAASLMLGTMLVWQRHSFEMALQQQNQPVIAPQLASVQQPAGSPRLAPPDIRTANWIALRQPATGYLGVRFTALTRGVDAIDSDGREGSSSGASGQQIERSQRDIMNDFFPSAKRDSHPRS
jgi:hypothetical protein